jgi:hypothetical protein
MNDRHANFDFIAIFYPVLEQVVFGSALSRARRFFTHYKDIPTAAFSSGVAFQ